MMSPSPNSYTDTWFTLFLAAPDPEQTAREVAFLKRNLPRPELTSILDVCCGYGRHAAPLAEAGYEVLGIDRDERAIARARALHAPDRLAFRVQDMTRLGELSGTFDAAICIWQSFGYSDAATNASVMNQMAARLRPGGRLVLDLYNREFFETRQGERVSMVRGETVVTRQRLDGDRLVVVLDYVDRRECESFDWQVFTPRSIVEQARRAGLHAAVTCTGFDEHAPPSPEEPRMQVVFEQ